jgi:hypothetical protein
MGKSAEQRFTQALASLGFEHEASDLAGQFKHQDFHLTFDGSVDVKSRKRIARADGEAQDELVWVEFANGRGRRGWLYGKATWIVFEVSTGFVCFSRAGLNALCGDIVDRTTTASSPASSVCKLYRRGLAELSLVPMSTLKDTLPHIEIKTKHGE